MASSKLLVIISSLLLVALAFPLAMAHEVEVVVQGKVYCQSCELSKTMSLTGAKPIPLAKVSVICKDYQKSVIYDKVFETDKEGHFYAELKGFTMGNHLLEHPLHACTVKLVSSPLKSCDLLSNINLGLNGCPLRYEDKILQGKTYKAVIYAAGPLAFRPAHCAPTNHY